MTNTEKEAKMADELKRQVVQAIFDRVKAVDGDHVYDMFDQPPTIDLMPQVDRLRMQFHVETPAGPRFFEVTIKESY